jgi:CheY-like chemotaxis protein
VSQPLVLAIEPDLRQAAILKRIIREKVLADVAVVDSRDAAIEAIRTCMPDVLLLSALLSPRDEDELITHLKSLENAGHLQTHTIPQLASTLQSEERSGRGLLSAFRKKKDPGPAAGCDPDLFADEIRVFLKRAEEKKRQLQDSNHAAPDMRPMPAGTPKAAAPVGGDEAAPQTSSWSSPFEWKPSASWSRSAPAPEPTEMPAPLSPIAEPANRETPSIEPLVAMPEPVIASPEPFVASPEPFVASPEPVVASSEPVVATPDPVFASPEPVVASAEPRKKDSGVRTPSTIRYEGLAAFGFATAGIWMRRESDPPAPANGPEDVRALLSTLAVPRAVASVSYPRGCRIRRVRVPASPDAESAETAGAVVASRRGAADRRPSA